MNKKKTFEIMLKGDKVAQKDWAPGFFVYKEIGEIHFRNQDGKIVYLYDENKIPYLNDNWRLISS